MNIQSLLAQQNMTMYRLAKISGVPKTTVLDICSGKSAIGGCNADTVLRLSRALGCTMEELMMTENIAYDRDTGKPTDKSYLERGLPDYLTKSLAAMIDGWKLIDSGRRDMRFDIHWCELSADINAAEVDQEISREQAGHLRKKYLRTEE